MKAREQLIHETLNAEQMLTSIIEHSNEIFYLHDTHHKLLYISPQSFQILGYLPAEMMIEWTRLVTDNPLNKMGYEITKKALATGQKQKPYLLEVFKKDGRKVFLEIEESPLKDEAGKVIGILGAARDITERKKSDEVIEEGERFLSSIFMSIQDGISILDADMTIVRVNSTMEKWYSHAMPLVGKKCFEVYHRRNERCELCPSFKTIETGKSAFKVIPKIGEDGNVVGWLELFTFPLFDIETGEMKGVIEYVHDITNRKQAEREIQKRLDYEHLLSEISALAIAADDLVAFQDQCLKIMGEVLNVSRVYIFEHRHDTETMDNTSEWVNAGISPQKANLQGLAAAKVPWWIDMMKNNRVIDYDDIEEIPGEKEKEILRAQEIKSILVVPLSVGGKYYGFIGFDECLAHRKWPTEDVDLLISASRIMTGTIERKRAEEAVRLYSRELEETNSALKVLLRQRDKDRKEMEEKILANVNQLIMPHIEMINRTGRLSLEEMSHIKIIESNLKEIVSSFSFKLLLSNLTPKELLIANLVKEGHRDKDIAGSLNLSIDTVKVHRKNIRKKLGITGLKKNLRSYLSSLT